MISCARLALSAISLAAVALCATVAPAAPTLAPTSYDMLNGETGSFLYFDESYDGIGSTDIALSPLTGGLGDLTDGVIASQHWYDNNLPHVGWFSTNPTTILFNFDGAKAFDTVSLYFDNAGPPNAGDVSSPLSWTATIGTSTFTYTTSATERASFDPAQKQTIALGGVAGTSLLVTVNRAAFNNYFMISEAEFTGSAVNAVNAIPEPASWALMLLGFGLTGAAIRRRRTLPLATS